ncbi:MAG: NADH:ubiquinone oxidoreductase subunit NDUFA12 [Alphaproteobacteria bacterium]|nr:NADH:ubiquinone oxidoreductase subunit NDUFA12 [Alphaproteobacteria bacterium]
MMTFGTWLLTIFCGRFVGKDEFGNRYYRMNKRGNLRRERRWVVYKGTVEGSKVPPMWHAWLSHTITEPPFEKSAARAAWQKEHVPNLTGTSGAYHPPGAIEKGAGAPEDYEAWRPN